MAQKFISQVYGRTRNRNVIYNGSLTGKSTFAKSTIARRKKGALRTSTRKIKRSYFKKYPLGPGGGSSSMHEAEVNRQMHREHKVRFRASKAFAGKAVKVGKKVFGK